jgi:hypothetical protein
MDADWTNDLTPDEAQAALDALKANKAPVTAREATELFRLRRVLEAKAEGRVEESSPGIHGRNKQL